LLLKYKTLPSFVKYNETKRTAIEDKNYICLICDENECEKHDEKVYLNPWNYLQIDEDLNETLENVLNYFLEEYVGKRIKESSAFVEELRKIIKFALSSFAKHLLVLDLNELILRDYISLFVNHFQMYLNGKRKAKNGRFLQEFVLQEYASCIHPAIKSRKDELKWIREWCDYMLPLLMPPKCSQLSLCFAREFLVCSIFQPLIELLSDPFTINTFVISIFEHNSEAKKKKKSAKKVQFLNSFVNYQKERDNNILGIQMKEIINDERLLFLFMKYLKSEGVVNLLQFILTLNSLNEKIFSPNFTENEDLNDFHEEMKETYNQYLREGGIDYINLNSEIKKLNLALFDAYEKVYYLLENYYLPHFLESDLFMKLIVGHRNILLNEEQILSIKKDTKKCQIAIYDDDADLDEEEEEEFVFKELNDLSSLNIKVEEFSKDLFLIKAENDEESWKVLRSKRDFAALEEKLRRFHGNNLYGKRKKDDLCDELELESLLKELISIPKLKCSQLLNNFLKDEEFETKNDLLFNDFVNSFKKLMSENRRFSKSV
ncbi:sorting nexin-14-like protein, partial [Dinothrombium tinctorium]